MHMLETWDHQDDKGLLQIDQHLFEVFYDGKRISLTATEYDLLSLLFTEQGRVLSREEILKRVWGSGDQGLRVVDTYVSRLRATPV